MKNKHSWFKVPLDHVQDPRGCISIVEKGRHFDFDVRRVFFLSNIESGQQRGHHAHQELQQIIFATSGSFLIDLDDGHDVETYRIEADSFGLFVNGPVWRVMRDFSPGAVMMVLCDRVYSEDKVIRNYDEFLREASNAK